MRLNPRIALAAGPAAAAVAVGLATTYGVHLLADGSGPEEPHAVGAAVGHEDERTLSRPDHDRAVSAALSSVLLRAFGDPSQMTVESALPTTGTGGAPSGAALVVRFPDPVSGTFRFFADPAGERQAPGVAGRRVYHELAVRDMAAVNVRVELPSGRITEISPADGTVIVGAEQAPTMPGGNGRGGN